MRVITLKSREKGWSIHKKAVFGDHFSVRLADSPEHQVWRLGVVVRKKIGHAVLRNRIKRRLRHAIQHVEPQTFTKAKICIIVVNSARVAHHPFSHVLEELTFLIHKAHHHLRPVPLSKLPLASTDYQ